METPEWLPFAGCIHSLLLLVSLSGENDCWDERKYLCIKEKKKKGGIEKASFDPVCTGEPCTN